jgi:hypothetical protein
MTGGKGREAHSSEAPRESDADIQQEQIVRSDIDERKDDGPLKLRIVSMRLLVKRYAKNKQY